MLSTILGDADTVASNRGKLPTPRGAQELVKKHWQETRKQTKSYVNTKRGTNRALGRGGLPEEPALKLRLKEREAHLMGTEKSRPTGQGTTCRKDLKWNQAWSV